MKHYALALLALPFWGCATETREITPEWVMELRLRSRSASGEARVTDAFWYGPDTAFIVCDMWDDHWCKGAARRVGELAPRMNEVLAGARKRGSLIIHAPSSTVSFYKDTPARKRAQDAPYAK